MDRSLKPRKRAFEQGSGGIDSSEMDVLEYSSEDSDDAREKMANLRRKGKEIMVQDVAVVDDDGCLHRIDEDKIGGENKGKGLLYASGNDNDSDDKKVPLLMEQSSSSTSAATGAVVDGDYSNNLTDQSSDTDQDDFNFDDDAYLEDLPENRWYGMDEISYLQTQFEKADIPSDIEVDIPWWSDPGQKNGKSLNISGSSNGNATQPMLDSGGKPDQTASSPEIKLTGDSILSTDISCTNGSNSVPCKNGSLPNIHAAKSFALAQTETPGVSSGTPQPKPTKEAAMMRLQQFEKFAVVDDYSDHYFADRPWDMPLEKASAKQIMDEWRILQNSLPDSIFVRVFESRMDLLRAVIIGPQGTPYHDGLFFFDVMFPSNYPQRPPNVYYYSGGLRLNPNLYDSGKVCLSLLGTWPGRSATENWIPGKSTLLQVLISIQGLILNANPYFNEPGISRYGDNNASELYTEETLLKSLKTMIYSMRKPLKHFEEFVPDYFISRSRDILLACNEYMKGAQVGSVSIVEGKAVKEKDKWCSSLFKDRVGSYLNSLIDEFSKLGVNNCDEFRVPAAATIKESAMEIDSKGYFTWTEMPESDPDFSQMGSIFTHKLGKAKSAKCKGSSSHSQFMSPPFAATPGVPYPHSVLPSDMYAAAFPALTPSPGAAYPIPQPSPLTSQLLFPPLVAYPLPQPLPHTALSSSSKPWSPSLSSSVHDDPPIAFVGSLQTHVIYNGRPVFSSSRPLPRHHSPNIHPVVNPDPSPRFRPSQRGYFSLPMPSSKHDDDLKGNVHKWSD